MTVPVCIMISTYLRADHHPTRAATYQTRERMTLKECVCIAAEDETVESGNR